MICSYYQELISRMLDEDLPPVEQKVLQAHLPNCEACSAMYKSFAALSDALEEQLEEPPVSLRYNVMAELRRAEIRRKNRLSRPMKIVLATAASLAVIIGVTAGAGVLRPMGKASPQSSVMLAGSNFASRSAPAEAMTEAAEAEEADEDLGFAPAAAAAGETYAAAADTTMDKAQTDVPAFDLSARLSREQLVRELGLVFVELSEEAELKSLYHVIVSDGKDYCVFSFYELDDQIFYTMADKGVYLATCTRDELEAILSR